MSCRYFLTIGPVTVFCDREASNQLRVLHKKSSTKLSFPLSLFLCGSLGLPELLQYPEPTPHLLQRLERLIQLFARVRCGHDGSDAGLAFRHCWEGDARRHQALIE
jgi:hypothetical protein